MNDLTKNSRVAFYVFSTLLMFFYIYQCNFSFIGIPHQLHSSRITVILFVAWAFMRRGGNNSLPIMNQGIRYQKKNIKFFLIIFLYSIVLIIMNGAGKGLNITTQLINIFLFGFTVLWAWNKIFNSIDEIMRVLLYVGIVQAVTICLCLAFPNISSLLDLTLNASEEREFWEMQMRRDYYAGGIGCIAAPGLIRYSSALVASVYMYISKKTPLYFVLYLFLGVVGTMIARTGLFMLIVTFIFLVIMMANNKRIISTGLLFLVAGSLLINIVDSGKYDTFISDRFKRYVSLNENKGEEFFTEYFSGETTEIPPLNGTTFWGGGILSGTSGNGYSVNVDGGFLRLYAAIGVIGVVLFYFFNILYMYKSTKNIQERNARMICLLFLLVLLIGETKENVLIMGWSVPMFYACVISAYKKQENKLTIS